MVLYIRHQNKDAGNDNYNIYNVIKYILSDILVNIPINALNIIA